MDTHQPPAEKSYRSQLFLPALFLGTFVTFTFSVFLHNALVDIASTLKVTVGTLSQSSIISLFAGIIVGLVVGILVVKYDHKTLFLLGSAFYGVGALGWFFAPSFASILFFNIFIGTGGAMTGIMIFAMIGDFLTLQKKAMAISLLIGAGFVANLIVPQVTSVITNAVGWRFVLLWFIFPMSVISLLFGFLVLPSRQHQELTANRRQYFKAFRQVLANKSAIACIVGTAIIWVSFLVPTYAVTFYRLDFKQTLSVGAIFYSAASVMGILGAVAGGWLINRIGRKTLTVAAGVVQGTFAVLIALVPNMWVSVLMWMVSAGFASAAAAGLTSLALEQIPGFRGTMMSLNESFRNIGLIVGLTISGSLLNLFANNFQILYSIFGAAGVASAAVVFFFAKDPCKNPIVI